MYPPYSYNPNFRSNLQPMPPLKPPTISMPNSNMRYFHPGDKAISFTLEGVDNLQLKPFSLKDYLGSWVLLFFYGSNFTYV